MAKIKWTVWLVSAAAILSALIAFFSMLYFNVLHAMLGKWTMAVVLAGPALALLLIVCSTVMIFKKRENLFFIPSVLAIVCCLLAFFFADSASLSKIEADYLKYETEFSQAVDEIKQQYISVSGDSLSIQEGVFPLASETLSKPVPEKKVQIIKIDDFHAIYYFIALDTDNRTEGYVYVPDDLYPRSWDDSAMWSDPLDINSKWWYVCLYKE